MHLDYQALSYLGQTNHHRACVRFGIKQADRLSHLYVVGQTGVGKSTLLEQLGRQDIEGGRGLAVIDPHGDLADQLYASLTIEERERAVYFNAADPAQPYGYNPLRRVRTDKIPLAASGLIEAFKKLWPDAWGARMEHVLRNSLYALLERDGSTLPDILRMYSDKMFRRGVLAGVTNPVVYAFWKSEFANYPPRYAAEALAPIQNKLGALLADPMLYRVLVVPEVDLHFRNIMDEGGVLLVNLAKGRLGSDSAQTLGSLLVSTLGLAGLSRAEMAPANRRPFFLYVDEFQSFTTLSFANMMTEIRKFGVGLTLAHQHLHQLEPEVRHAVLGNAATLISFRTGVEDAALLARELAPAFVALDLVNLPNRSFYLRLMIDGAPSNPFSATLLPQS
jgi:energy-coupling factor transporter ATP-binding protein EcfA2